MGIRLVQRSPLWEDVCTFLRRCFGASMVALVCADKKVQCWTQNAAANLSNCFSLCRVWLKAAARPKADANEWCWLCKSLLAVNVKGFRHNNLQMWMPKDKDLVSQLSQRSDFQSQCLLFLLKVMQSTRTHLRLLRTFVFGHSVCGFRYLPLAKVAIAVSFFFPLYHCKFWQAFCFSEQN